MPTQTQQQEVLTTDHLHADLKGRSVRGGVVTLVSQGAQFVIQSVATIVLARLLTPADFGLVAMVWAITWLGQSFADFGLSEATIQHPELRHEQVSTLFWINVGIGVGLMLITASLAPVLTWFYREPRLKGITLALSLIFLFGGLRVQHDALLKRQMRFVALAIRDVASVGLAVPVAIILALKGYAYWALVAHALIGPFGRMAFSWMMIRWIPGRHFRASEVGSLVKFGGNVAASYVIYNVNRSADSVLIGWYWGANPLGLYSRAFNLLMLPVRQLNAPVSSVAIPAYSRIQAEPERLARYYLRTVNLVVWICAPVFAYLFVTADPVIVLLLGRKWVAAAPVFQILVVSAIGQVLLDTTVWLFVSMGKSAQFLKMMIVISPIVILSFAVGLPFGIKGVALSGSLVLIAMLPWILRYTFRGTQLTLRRLGGALLCPISLSLAGIVFGEFTLHLFARKDTIPQLLAAASGFAVAYGLSLLVPTIREEVLSLRKLFTEMRQSSGS